MSIPSTVLNDDSLSNSSLASAELSDILSVVHSRLQINNRGLISMNVGQDVSQGVLDSEGHNSHYMHIIPIE